MAMTENYTVTLIVVPELTLTDGRLVTTTDEATALGMALLYNPPTEERVRIRDLVRAIARVLRGRGTVDLFRAEVNGRVVRRVRLVR